jgi:ABC-2 type transport system ATP-binding protein
MEAVHAEDLTKRFGDFTAVDHVSFSVEKGEVFGFLGPNGAGKTTTISMLCTLLHPTEGQATVSGFNVVKDAYEVRKRIGFGRLYKVPNSEMEFRIEQLLKLVDLWDWRDNLVSNFSSGMRQRLNLIRALVHDPEIIFLDEPTVGLDPATALNIREFIAQLNQEGHTIILTTHQMEVADKLSDRISIIDQGKIVALETLADLKAKVGPDASLEDVFIKLTGSRMRDAPKKNRFFVPQRRWSRRHF